MKDYDLTELRWKVEMTMSSQCWLKERLAGEEGKEYKCNCSDVYEMTKDDLRKYLDENEQ